MYPVLMFAERGAPAGIEVLRNAKAELIKAQAQYATAQAALMSAEVAYQELENAEKALDNRLKEAQVAYEEARLELLKAQNAAESEAIIAYWEAEMLKWQNKKEAMIADHEWEMLKKQTAIANAEKEYNEALAALELASASLSDAEEEAINGYRQDIENVRKALETVYKDLYSARTDLLDAKYSFDREKVIAQEQRVLENMQIALTYAQKFYDEAKAVDFQAGNDEWRTKVDELDAQIEEIQKQLDAYKIQAAELENSKKGDEDAIEQIEASIVVLEDQLEKVMAWADERVSTSIKVPATVAESLRSVFEASFDAFKENSDAAKGPVLTSYYTTVNGVDYTLADGAVAWYATKGENYSEDTKYYEGPGNTGPYTTFKGLKTLKEGVAAYVLAPDVLSQVQANLTSKYLNFPTEAEFTAKYNAMVAAKDAYIKLAVQYGFDYLGDKMVETGSMWSEALDAVKTLREQRVQRTLTDAEVTALLAQVGEALDVRFSMTGYNQDFNNFPEWADAKEAFVGTEETTVPINFWLDQVYTENEMETALGATPTAAAGILITNNDAADVDEADWSPFHKWDSYSTDLYGKRVYYPLTVEDMAGVGFVFGQNYPENLPDFGIYISKNNDATEELKAKLDVNGITSVKDLKGTVWFQVARAAYATEQINALVNNQADYAAVLASIEEEYDALVAEDNATAEERLAINEQIETQEAAKVPYQEHIDAIDAQIKALVGEWVPDQQDPEKGDYNYDSWTTYGIAEAQKTRLEGLQDTYENLIEENKVTIPKYGTQPVQQQYPIGSDEAIKAYTEYLDYLAEELAKDEDEITKQEGLITALQNEEDGQTLYIEYCQTNLDMVQAQYDALIAQFNYYNEQLTALLDAITSGEDVPEQPENPETPENPGEGGEETPAA